MKCERIISCQDKINDLFPNIVSGHFPTEQKDDIQKQPLLIQDKCTIFLITTFTLLMSHNHFFVSEQSTRMQTLTYFKT